MLQAVSHLWALPAFSKALQMATETNCITEYLQESESQVRKAKPAGKLGLLYGVPVSLKDSIDCQVTTCIPASLGLELWWQREVWPQHLA